MRFREPQERRVSRNESWFTRYEDVQRTRKLRSVPNLIVRKRKVFRRSEDYVQLRKRLRAVEGVGVGEREPPLFVGTSRSIS